MKDNSFAGNLYVVTGASRGIGRSISELLLQRGAEVVGVGRNEKKLREIERRHSGFSYIVMDLSRPKAGEELARQLKGVGVHGLINNAGYAYWGDPLKVPVEEYRRMTQLLYLTPIELSHSLLPELKGGVVVNVISAIVHVRFRRMTGYGAAKSALHYYTVGARKYYKKRGVHLMAVYPGPVKTDFFSHPSFEGEVDLLRGFSVTPEKVARATLGGIKRKACSIYVPWYLRVISLR